MIKKEVNMLSGPLFKNIILFAFPLMLSGILQLLFNAADVVVVGQFSGSHSLAAVGSTSALINLLVNLFIGLSIGASVLLGRYIGSGDHENATETVHTAMAVSMVGGVIMIFVGIVFARSLLEMMSTPDDVIDLATLYLRIYFLGMPGFMVYNFGAALLRAVGDTKSPLYFLTVAGIVNVIFNLIFVIVFGLGVAGVAIATDISQYISAAFIILSLVKSEDVLHLDLKNMHFHKDKIFAMMRIGLPAGLQGTIFSISNVLIQSSINSFGQLTMAGNTAASNIEGFVYTSMNSLYQACLSFTSQNLGAKQFKRIDKILINSLILVSIVGLVLGIGAYLLGNVLLAIYNSDPEVIAYGLNRLAVVSASYFLCGLMDVLCGSMRGMGYSVIPMVVSLIGSCAFRVVWIFTVFAIYHTQFVLYLSYPISWILTSIAHFICYLFIRRKVFHQGELSLARE